jgi:hypothetical protein
MSRVFEVDQNIFSTSVYERAFRWSIQQSLKRQAIVAPSAKHCYEKIYLIGDDGIGKDSVIDALGPIDDDEDSLCWTRYQYRMQQLFVELIRAIIKHGTPDWNAEQVSVICDNAPLELESSFEQTLHAWAILWWGAVRRMHEPDPDTRGCRREVHLRRDFVPDELMVGLDMVFDVNIIPDGGLRIHCKNRGARL